MAPDRREEGLAQSIPVAEQPSPKEFHSTVGKKGAAVLAKHKPKPPVKSGFWEGKEHWRRALDDLSESYRRVCAFAAIRIERVTGARSVEHFKPKRLYPELAYEWSNFRLVCGMMNGRKGDFEDVLDPFEIPENTFDLNPLSGEVLVHRDCPGKLIERAKSTNIRLKLNDGECLRVRREHMQRLDSGDWTLAEARRQSPFVVACLERQGLI